MAELHSQMGLCSAHSQGLSCSPKQDAQGRHKSPFLQHPTGHNGRAALGESRTRLQKTSARACLQSLMQAALATQTNSPRHGFTESFFNKDVRSCHDSQHEATNVLHTPSTSTSSHLGPHTPLLLLQHLPGYAHGESNATCSNTVLKKPKATHP